MATAMTASPSKQHSKVKRPSCSRMLIRMLATRTRSDEAQTPREWCLTVLNNSLYCFCVLFLAFAPGRSSQAPVQQFTLWEGKKPAGGSRGLWPCRNDYARRSVLPIHIRPCAPSRPNVDNTVSKLAWAERSSRCTGQTSTHQRE